MLQRQIMFKQMQELQRRQQLQELGGSRNQDYVDQLTLLKQVSAVQLVPTGNKAPIHDSRMLMFDNMQMIQQGESSIFQGFPSGMVLPQGHSNALGPIGYSPQGITTQRNTFEGGLGDVGWPGDSPGEVSKLGMPEAAASLDPLEQKMLYSSDDQCWLSSFGTSNKMGAGDFECTVENPSFVDTLPSIQSGSWSALMQSAVTETSSSDTAVQEEWSGLSFQNPEPSSDNQPSNFSNGEKLQDNRVDRSLQNVSSPSSEPEQLFPRPNMNCSFPGFQHSGKQYVQPKDEFQCESSHVSGQCSPRNTSQLAQYESQLKHHPTGGKQPVQTSFLSENIWPAEYKENLKTGHEPKDTLWSSNPVSGGFQIPLDQLNQPNFHWYSVNSEKMGPGDNVGSLSAHIGASDLYGQNVAAQSMIPNTQGFVFKADPTDLRTPQSYTPFPSLPVGNVNVKSLPNSYEKDYIKNQHPTPPVPSQMNTELPACSDPSSEINFQSNSSSRGPRFSFLESVAVTRPSRMSVTSQRVGFPTGLLPMGRDVTTQQDLPSPIASKFSSSVFQTPGSASSSLETEIRSSLQASQTLIKPEHDVGYHEQRLEKASFLPESSTKMHNSSPLSSNTDSQPSLRKHYSGVDGVASGSFTRHTSPRPSDQVEQKDTGTPVNSVSGSGAFGHSLHQNYSLLHQLHRPRDGQTDCATRFPINYQQANTNSRDLLLSGHNVAGKDKAKSNLEGMQLRAFSSGNDKGNFIQEAQADQSGYLQSSQQMEMFSKNDSQNLPIDSKEASNVSSESQISLQMAPSWFKHYGSLKNDQAISTCNPKAAITEMQPFSGLSIEKLPENRLVLQVDSAITAQGSKYLSPPSTLPSDVICRDLAVSNLKKRKVEAIDLVPWHRELNCEALIPQNIRMAEFEWAQSLDRRQEEAKDEAEIVDDVHPVVRAKRRLISTTQLMQQVFRPSLSSILFGDISSNYDYVAYSAARTALGDACNLNNKMPSDSNDVSPDKLTTSKRITECVFSKIVDCLISRADKLESDLSRLDGSLLVVDIKVESQELEKLSTLNRFAKFHFKVHPSTVNPASSSGLSPVQNAAPQRYVIAVPMPNILPEGRECISL